jgi:phenylacetic acid degradation operon negative regulatory protein
MERAPVRGFLEVLRSRIAEGTRPRQLLVTMMADYWLAEGAVAPAGALVDLMRDLGITESGARTLLSRLTKEGRLTAVKDGRRTFYRLSDQAHDRLVSGLRQISEFSHAGRSGTDSWTAIAFSIPENRRAVRQQLRKGLSWLGFAPLYDGFWVTPRRVSREAAALCHKLGLESASIFDGRIERIGALHGNPTDAWNIAEVHELYGEFINETKPVLAALEDGGLDPATALMYRTALINVWRVFPRLDPDLPLELLPSGWLRGEAQAVFERLYDALAPAAVAHVREAVSRHSPDHAGFVAGHLLRTRTWAP